jgi:hypothetical protein
MLSVSYVAKPCLSKSTKPGSILKEESPPFDGNLHSKPSVSDLVHVAVNGYDGS